jgi:N-acetylglucosamine-6-phosphate deacetylase
MADMRLPEGAILAPGFIDLQVNGAGGIMFNDSTDAAGLRHIAAALARVGTTSFLPTLISGGREKIAAAMAAARAAAADVPGVLGVHIEGPFIAPSRRGIHPATAMLAMTDADVALLSKNIGGRTMVTLAPEIVSPAHVAALAAAGVIVFAGHSDATFAQARAGMAAGITGVTHLFNAMSPLMPRAPGMAGAALAARETFAGIIVDGIHVHPASVAIAHAAKGASRLFLVSDCMATAASESESFVLYGTPIHLRDGRLTDAAGTLAGANLTMSEAVRNAITLAGIAPPDALRMATATPAACLGLTERGQIARGYRADLVALAADWSVIAVWIGGTRVEPV